MTTGAIVMMLVAMIFLWGGLGLALFNLTRKRPTPPGAPGASGGSVHETG